MVNAEAELVQGVASVELKVGTWQGKCSLRAVTLDDFDLILGMDFLLLAKVTVVPYLSGLFIVDVGCPSFVQMLSKVGSLAYRLKLPDRLKVHPTFHVSFLKKFQEDLVDRARQ
ncbi:hypothetical protein Salat_2160200 [Sesamum alatum]|uniref:Tf2-1-like SH3-like domain-containing protein n=1 Tax=Sesamum alatum TaxID=300844 RepID=A0AAE1Y231_9LAMI|nr:hypothetical protein Salat_2160200 [Sesamum alatum]